MYTVNNYSWTHQLNLQKYTHLLNRYLYNNTEKMLKNNEKELFSSPFESVDKKLVFFSLEGSLLHVLQPVFVDCHKMHD